MTTLASTRLILRPWRAADAAPFAEIGADPEVMAHFPSLLTRTESAAMIERIVAHFEREGFGLWAVEVPGVAPFIGFAGLARPAWRPDVIEVGWRLARSFWGNGYATEAGRTAVDFGFDRLGLAEIVSFVVPGNVRSQAVMARLGMHRDLAGDFEHPLIPAGHPLRPHWLFRLSKT